MRYDVYELERTILPAFFEESVKLLRAGGNVAKSVPQMDADHRASQAASQFALQREHDAI